MFVLVCTCVFRLLVMLARLSNARESFSATATRLVSMLVRVALALFAARSSCWLKSMEKSQRPSEPLNSRSCAVISARFVAAGRAPAANAFKFDAACALWRSEEHTSELQSRSDLVCRLLLEKKKKRQ